MARREERVVDLGGVSQVTEVATGKVVGHALVERLCDGSHLAHVRLSPEATSAVSSEEG